MCDRYPNMGNEKGKRAINDYSMQRNQLRKIDTRREDGSSMAAFIGAPLCAAVDDGEEAGDDEDGDDDDDDEMEVVNLGVADEIEGVAVVDVVLGWREGVV